MRISLRQGLGSSERGWMALEGRSERRERMDGKQEVEEGQLERRAHNLL